MTEIVTHDSRPSAPSSVRTELRIYRATELGPGLWNRDRTIALGDASFDAA